MADAQMTLQVAQIVLVEYLGDQAYALLNVRGLAVTGGDAGRLLAAVLLQRVYGEVGQAGNVRSRGAYPKERRRTRGANRMVP